MKKKIIIICSMAIMIPFLLLGIAYIGLVVYYANRFVYGVFVNGIYVTGKSVEEVNHQLMLRTDQSEIEVRDKFGEVYELNFSEYDYTFSYLSKLEEIHKKQNPLLWIYSLEDHNSYNITPSGEFNKIKLEQEIKKIRALTESGNKNNIKVSLDKTKDGYVLTDTINNYLNTEKVVEVIGDALAEGVYFVDLEESECYEKAEYTESMKKTLGIWKKIEVFQDCNITYEFDNGTEVIDASVVCDWILCEDNGDFLYDEKGDLQLDEEKIKDYVRGLAEKYDTVNQDRLFQATRGDTVTVTAGTYGNKLNEKAEIEYLLTAFAEKRKEDHIPEYSQKAWGSGSNDIGETYIEVDLTEQKLYYYREGVRKVEANIVTGNISRGHGTPQKACYVYFMQRNRVLIGEDYRTPVDYWIAVYGNIGIHDAKWRRNFGDNIYKTNGSHGCINTPYTQVSELYGMVEVGTPVMIFY